ncbi:MAG: nuclear transport factor 2 family protein [Streptococcaceae bacterium]|jgi:ketosteroid isomerase-like protein|nr:nuclear transport factor 2 family protein [Streptococcaceae bacterium]
MQNEIFRTYCQTWLNKDLSGFLALLSEDISYTECYGAQYQGKAECEAWFQHWFSNSENQVLSWEINSDSFDATHQTGFFTWTFECFYGGKLSKFDGASMVKFDENWKIIEIQEFEQKYEKFRPFS